MADKNTGVGRERVGKRSDEEIIGREPAAGERTGEYGDTSTADRTAGGAGYTASPAREAVPEVRTREIRAEIEQTREDLSETVNAIQDRLRPGTIASNAADSVKQAARERVRDMADTESVQYVRSNPVPTAMVGIGIAGLAWLAFGGREPQRSRRGQYRSPSRDWRVAPAYGEDEYYRPSRASGYDAGAAHGTGAYDTSGASDYSSSRGAGYDESRDYGRSSYGADGGGEHLSDRARQTAYRAQNQLQRTWNESPLLIGAAAAVLGAIVGAAVPETERENRLMGETRDNMLEGVQQAVKDKVEDVQNAASNAVSQVQSAVGLTTDDKSSAEPNKNRPGNQPRS